MPAPLWRRWRCAASPDRLAAREFRAADIQEESYPTVQALLFMDKLVAERTGGRHRIRVFHSRQLGEESQTIEQTRVGAIDLNRINVAAIGDVAPVLNILAQPFLFRSIDHLYKVIDGPIGDDILAAIEPNGFIGLTFYDSGARSIYTRSPPVRGLPDLKGLRIRVQQSDLVIRMMKALGAEPVVLPYGQVLTALSARLVDGAENNWPSYVTTGHYKVAQYYTVTEHTMGPEVLVMSRRAWQELSDADRAIFRAAAREFEPVHAGPVAELGRAIQEAGRGGRRHHHRQFRSQAVRGCDPLAARRDARRSQVRAVDRADPGRAMSHGAAPAITPVVERRNRRGRARRRARWTGCVRCRSDGASSRSPRSTSRSRSSSRSSSGTARRFSPRRAAICARAVNPTASWRSWRARPGGCKASSTAISPSPTTICCRRSRSCANRCSAPCRTAPSWTRSCRPRPPRWSQATERFVAGFDELRNVQNAIMDTYENQVLAPAREMSGLYAIVEGATTDRNALVWPALSKSRESFSTTLVLTNVFYLQHEPETATEVTRNLERIESTIPVMLDLADNDLQRGALRAIQARAAAWRMGIAQLAQNLVDPRAAPERRRRRQSGRHGQRDRAPVQQHAGAGTHGL